MKAMSRSPKLRAQVTQHYAIFAHDPQIMTIAVEAMLDELDKTGITDETAASVWLERQCTRVIREVGLEVAQQTPQRLITSEADGKHVRIRRSDVAAARRLIARNVARMAPVLALFLAFGACTTSCGAATDAPPDERTVTLGVSPWCYETHELEGGYYANVLHFGVLGKEGTPWRVDVEAGAEQYTLPGKARESSDTYVKVRVEGLPAEWSNDVGVRLYVARGDAWVEMDRRSGMQRCAP